MIFSAYLVLPSPNFPEPPVDAILSVEPADSEDLSIKRAYFTNLSRDEVQEHYRKQFSLGQNLNFLTLKLTYPPEEAYTLIRDQTRSTHLVEFVIPFRESFFVNEFMPKDAKDDIWINEMHFNQKITVKIYDSRPFVRVLIGIAAFIMIFILFLEWVSGFKELWLQMKNLPNSIRLWRQS